MVKEYVFLFFMVIEMILRDSDMNIWDIKSSWRIICFVGDSGGPWIVFIERT